MTGATPGADRGHPGQGDAQRRKEHYREYLASDRWRYLADRVRTFRGNRCEWCWATDRLEVHHLTYDRLGAEDWRDLIVLCRRCHQIVEAVKLSPDGFLCLHGLRLLALSCRRVGALAASAEQDGCTMGDLFESLRQGCDPVLILDTVLRRGEGLTLWTPRCPEPAQPRGTL